MGAREGRGASRKRAPYLCGGTEVGRLLVAERLSEVRALPTLRRADATYIDLLNHLGLDRLAARLHDYEPWSRILSPGEQQRIAAARAILAAPDFLFVDEATSALDAASEETLYGLLAERLPNTALISVAHRQSVERYHDTTIKLESGETTRTPITHAANPA